MLYLHLILKIGSDLPEEKIENAFPTQLVPFAFQLISPNFYLRH